MANACSKVSIIIPAYNAASYLPDSLSSIFMQTHSNYDVILVDDGSTDDTAAKVAVFGSRVHYYLLSNSGGYPGLPRNVGMSLSDSDYICFLDADDIMLSDRVERQVAFLNANPDVGIVFSDYRNFSNSGQFTFSHFQTCSRLQNMLRNRPEYLLPSIQATALLLQENIGLPSSAMIRRSVLQKVPGFSTDLKTSEDFHFFYRIARQYAVGVVNHVGSLRRLHDNNITGNSLKILHNYVLSRADLFKTECDPINKRLLAEFIAQREIDLARAYADRRDWQSALCHNLRGMKGIAGISANGLMLGLRTLARTAAIALHVKSP